MVSINPSAETHLFDHTKIIVIKVGSSLLVDDNKNNTNNYMRMFTVPTDGKTITLTYATTFDNNQNNNTGTYYSLAKVDSDTYALAHTGTQNDGYIKTFEVIAGDKVLPVISYVKLNDNNAAIDVTFNENVFSSAGASGNLDANDFVCYDFVATALRNKRHLKYTI